MYSPINEFAGARVRIVKERHSPNRDRFARLSADLRHHCFDHATRGHTGRTGSKRAPLHTRPTTAGPSAPIMTLSSFRVLPMNHMAPHWRATRSRNSRPELIGTMGRAWSSRRVLGPGWELPAGGSAPAQVWFFREPQSGR